MNVSPRFYLRQKSRLHRQAGLKTVPAFAEANELVSAASTGTGVLCGYWSEWEPRVALEDIPTAYTHVCVAFLNSDDIPVFTTYYYSPEELIEGIRVLKSQGREVLISIGGASGNINLSYDDKTMFKNELFEIIETYGFTGVDIDLEGASVRAGANDTVIPVILRELKDYYRSRGSNFLVTMAPEFRYLRGHDASYLPYIQDLEGYYDIIWPQYYNQGADGIWSETLRTYLSQNDNALKADFLYTLTHAIVTGTQDFVKIPADKFAIGLPASPEAALNGYVENPEDIRKALARLEAEGNSIRGLMTWSVNHDMENGYQFEKWYSPMV